jgi:hypothetical protein
MTANSQRMNFDYMGIPLVLLSEQYLLSIWSQMKELKGEADFLTCQESLS